MIPMLAGCVDSEAHCQPPAEAAVVRGEFKQYDFGATHPGLDMAYVSDAERFEAWVCNRSGETVLIVQADDGCDGSWRFMSYRLGEEFPTWDSEFGECNDREPLRDGHGVHCVFTATGGQAWRVSYSAAPQQEQVMDGDGYGVAVDWPA
jgi:hypothetical protein